MNPKATALIVSLTLLTCISAAPADVELQPYDPSGGVQLYTGVFVSGSPSTKYDIVFIGDGFTASQQDQFNWKVEQAVQALWHFEPYADHMCAFNIWRVNVVSNESGIDKPGAYPAIYKDTALDCTFGNPLDPDDPTPYRLIKSESPGKCWEAASYAPAHDAIFVLANDPEWGGASGQLVFSSIHPDFHQIITHELGHKIGGLADEYDYYLGLNDAPSTYTGAEPSQPNVTTKTLLAEIKWNDLIAPSTPLPTTTGNASEYEVGIWEGALYKDYDIYRPQHACQMRDSEDPFCRVCERRMIEVLETYETEPPEFICSGGLFELLEYDKLAVEKDPWHFLLPGCLRCPPSVAQVDEVVFVMRDLPPGFEMHIVDEMGQTVAEGVRTKDGLLAIFDADPTRQYYADIIGEAAMIGETIDYRAELLINGEEMALP